MSNSNETQLVEIVPLTQLVPHFIVAGGLIGGISGYLLEKNKPEEKQSVVIRTIEGVAIGCLGGMFYRITVPLIGLVGTSYVISYL